MSKVFGNLAGVTKIFALILVLSAVFSTPSLQAQLFRGYISGTVSDPQNAAIGGAEVTVRNLATGVAQTVKTNEVGFYRVPALDPSTYSVEIKMTGFETQKVESVILQTSAERTVNAKLKVGAITASIDVTVAGLELAKTNPNIEHTFAQRTVEELPVGATRDASNIPLFAPLVSRSFGQNGFSADGQRSRNTNFSLDGVNNNDYVVTIAATNVPLETIKEVQVGVSTYSAEFGRNTGAQVNVITKSGGNSFHGSIYDYYRGNAFDAFSLSNRRAGFTKSPSNINNQFGGDIGGPVIKDKTFFYGFVQGDLRRQAPNGPNATAFTIPTPAGYAALQTVPLRAGQSAASRQTMLDALKFLPDIYSQIKNYDNIKNVSVSGVQVETATVRVPLALPQDNWYTAGNIDHYFTNTDHVFYRYHYLNSDRPDTTGNQQFGTKWTAAIKLKTQNHALGYTKTIGSNLVNEFRFAFTRRDQNSPERDPVTSTATITGFFTIGGLSTFPQQRVDDVYQFQNVTHYVLGRHSLKAGIDLRRNVLDNLFPVNAKGTWAFSSMDNFLNNTASSLTQALTQATVFKIKQLSQNYFVQDDFKAARNLTLNIGLRYETSSVPFGFFGATDPAIRAVGVEGPVKRDTNNWAPRIGFAYSPTGGNGLWGKILGDSKSSIRGGFGISYDVLYYNILLNTALSYPRSVTQTDTNVVDVFPTLKAKTATIPALDPLTSTFINTPADSQNPTTNYWSLSVQRQYGQSTTVEIGYSGNRSYHAVRQGQQNPPSITDAQAAAVIANNGNPAGFPSVNARRANPAWGSRQTVETTGKGEYHALFARLDKRITKRFLIGMNYTWSANFSDSEEPLNDSTVTLGIARSSPQIPQDFRNVKNEWSRSVFDHPHHFAMHYIYDIPGFNNLPERWHKYLVNGWQIAGTAEMQSGSPFTIRTGVDSLGNNVAPSPSARPNYNPNGIIVLDPVTNNLRTFTIPKNDTGLVYAPRSTTSGALLANSMPTGGNLGRNTFRGPGFANFNFSILKTMPVRESVKLKLRADFINVFNHDNFQNPDPLMNNPTFGTNTAVPITDERQVVVSAKIAF